MAVVAVFVDAGYLFAQGSAAISGSKKPRTSCKLNEVAVVSGLTSFAQSKSSGSRLLRIYWYDGAKRSGATLDQKALARMDYVKLRLGLMNGQGEQKGVDSLIVTDIVELARNRAITDAVLLSGDEDVRIGVQIAQTYGVRVHLLGIVPSRGSQSPQLLEEADTTFEWDQAVISGFLSISATTLIQAQKGSAVAKTTASTPSAATTESDVAATFNSASEDVCKGLIQELQTEDIIQLKVYWETSRGVPPEYDGRLLARCREAVRRDLINNEKRAIRTAFEKMVRALSQIPAA